MGAKSVSDLFCCLLIGGGMFGLIGPAFVLCSAVCCPEKWGF